MTVHLTNLEDNADYYVQVEGSTVNGLEFITEREFEFNVSHYNSDNLTEAMHQNEVIEDNSTNIRIDYKNSGMGSAACGPRLSEKYRLSEEYIEFTFWINCGKSVK